MFGYPDFRDSSLLRNVRSQSETSGCDPTPGANTSTTSAPEAVSPEAAPESLPQLFGHIVRALSFLLGAATFVVANFFLFLWAYPTMPNPGPQSDIRLPLYSLVVAVILITFLFRRIGAAFGAGFFVGFLAELLFVSGCTRQWIDPGGTALADARMQRYMEGAALEAEARAKAKWVSEVREHGLDLAVGLHRLELATGCVLDQRQKHGELPTVNDSLPDMGEVCSDLQLRKNDETGWRTLYARVPGKPGGSADQFRITLGPDPALRIKGPVLEVDSHGLMVRRDSAGGPAFAVGSPLQPITGVLMNCTLKRYSPISEARNRVVTLLEVRRSNVRGCGAMQLVDVKDDGGTLSPDSNLARLHLPTTRALAGFPLEDLSTSWDITYVPQGKAPADGYDLQVRPMMYGFTGVRSYLLSGGGIHVTWENRRAMLSDPLAEPCELDFEKACDY